jgi:protein SERAC1
MQTGVTRELTYAEQVVDKDSAIISDAREYRGTIHADHVGMAKFSTRSDPGYKKVLGAIEMLLQMRMSK